MSDHTWWLAMPVLPGSQEAVERIQQAGHNLFFVSRPWDKCREWMWARKQWLKKHFDVAGDTVIPIKHKYLVGGDAFVDDRVEDVKLWSEYHQSGRAILFDAPWNKDAKRKPRMSWADVDNPEFSFLFGKS